MECASSDLLHYVLQGLEPPPTIDVPVTKIGDLTVIRMVRASPADLPRNWYDLTQKEREKVARSKEN